MLLANMSLRPSSEKKFEDKNTKSVQLSKQVVGIASSHNSMLKTSAPLQQYPISPSIFDCIEALHFGNDNTVSIQIL
jgi:hypothetical protein